MSPDDRLGRPGPQLTEGSVGQDLPVGLQRLAQDLLAVRDEQERRATGHGRVVERGDDRLARARGSNDQVAVPVVDLALDGEVVKDLLLVRVRANLQAADGERCRGPVGVTAGDGQRLEQPFPVGVGVVAHERRVLPQTVEGGLELGDELGGVHPGEPDVPLQPVQQRSAAEVGASDVSGVRPAVTAKEPSLRVQAGRPGLVVDLDVSPEVAHQPVEGGLVGRTHVRRGQHPERDSPRPQAQQLLLQHAQAEPLHEGAEQVDAVSGRQLRSQLLAELRIAARVRKQSRPAHGHLGPDLEQAPHPGLVPPCDCQQLARAGQDPVLVPEQLQNLVGLRDLVLGRQLSQGLTDRYREVLSERARHLGWVDRLACVLQADQCRVELLGQDLFVDTGWQLAHPGSLPARRLAIGHFAEPGLDGVVLSGRARWGSWIRAARSCRQRVHPDGLPQRRSRGNAAVEAAGKALASLPLRRPGQRLASRLQLHPAGRRCPSLTMLEHGQGVGLRLVAAAVGEHQVGQAVERGTGPRQEVVDVSRTPDAVAAVEADVVLQLAKRSSRPREAAPLRAEQEARQVQVLSVEVVEPCDVVGPGPLDHRPQQAR